MRALDLKNKNIVIWGTGREACAAFDFIRRFLPTQPITFIDETRETPQDFSCDAPVICDPELLTKSLRQADVIIKSPGVSLYHPLLKDLRERHIPITSLLNLWSAEPRNAKTIYVTGTKGKSTTASLLAHMLKALQKRTALVGNIGIPVSDIDDTNLDFIVIETSSYQAATFNGRADVALLTSLYPEHLDWHITLDRYYRDKLNLLQHATLKIINAEALSTLQELGIVLEGARLANTSTGLHIIDTKIYDGDQYIGTLSNNHLARHHNLMNVCCSLTLMQDLGFDPKPCLNALETFKGLPHRQQELGEKDGVLYVNDSISTTPQSAIAAMDAYADKPITILLGGFDRGIDYTPLVNYILTRKNLNVLCMGPSGVRIASALEHKNFKPLTVGQDLIRLLNVAKSSTPQGGVILLSPAAPSYGLFKNFEERGLAFTREAGF